MTRKLLVLILVLAFWLVVLSPLAAGTGTTGIPLGPGPVIIDTTTEQTTAPTLLPTLTEPTTEPTTYVTPIGNEKGWIDVYGNVEGASVYFDGTYEGSIAGGILSVAVPTTSTPISTIMVSMSGYTTWTGRPSHMPSQGEHVAVYATINPLTTIPTTIPPPPSTGAIYAQSSPAGSAIYLNGNFYGYSPLTIPNLAPGTYSMKATLSGYTPDNTLVNVYAGQTAPYYPTLQQSPQPRQTGTVYVTSLPSHASVYADGGYYGTTPLTITLYPGTHQIVVKETGYNDYSTSIWVAAGQAQNLQATMTTATQGTVVISSVPGATVYIDSNGAGTIGSSGSLTLTGVNAGNRLFKVTAPGYNDWMNTVYIQANTVNTISAPLTPSGVSPTPVPSSGSLAISSLPSNAQVYVDNLYRGVTPVTVTDLAAGDHVVRLSEDGYVDYTTTTTVAAGQVSPLALTLAAAPTPTPTPAPAPGPVLVIGALAVMAMMGGYLRRRC